MIRVTIFNEYRHEKVDEAVRSIYPNGIHNAIADFLRSDEIEVKTVTLDDPDCGITDEVLDNTDVIGQDIAETGADIVGLQEVDMFARRSGEKNMAADWRLL